MNSPNNLLDETLFVRNYGHARLSSSRRTWRETVSFRLRRLGIRVQEIWESMNTPQRILTVFVLLVLFVLGIIFLIISKNIIHWLIPMAEQWESSTFVCFIVWALTFTVSFPPLIGWGLLGSISGFLFGLWKGYASCISVVIPQIRSTPLLMDCFFILVSWLVFASGTVIGSATSIIVCRTVLSGYVHRLVQHDHRFKALAATIKTDGLKLLCLIRLCPLPYSICNGAMSTFPSVSPLTYGLATMIVSPKLLLITFIGSRLRILSESGEKMSLAAKIVNVFSILLTCLVGAGTGLYIYRKSVTTLFYCILSGRISH